MGRIQRAAWKRTRDSVQKRQPVGICCLPQTRGLCDHPEGWDGEGGGSGAQEGGELCPPAADACCCKAEGDTILQSNYPPITNKDTQIKRQGKRCTKKGYLLLGDDQAAAELHAGILRAKRNESAREKQRRENRPFENATTGGINSGGRILMWGLLSKLKPQRHKRE